MEPTKPWAFIAHKDAHWAGVIAADATKKEIKKFLGEFAADGFSILTVHNRDEYNKVLDTMKIWHEHPDYKRKKKSQINGMRE